MDWLNAPGWVGRFARWNSANNGFPLLWHGFAALVALGAASGKRLWVPYDNKPIWLMQSVVLVGRSGLGKGWIISETCGVIEDALGPSIKVVDISTTSPEAIPMLAPRDTDGVTQTVPVLIALDEFSTMMSKRDYAQAMTPRLCTLLQNGDRPFEDPRVSDRPPLKNLMWIMFAGSTEDMLEDQLAPGAIGGGLPSRALWPVARHKSGFVGGRPGPNDREERSRLVAGLTQLSAMQGEVTLSAKAEVELLELQRECHDAEEADPRYSGHFSRKPRTILRLAALLALGDGVGQGVAPREIGESELLWARMVHDELDIPMFEMFERVVSSGTEKNNLHVMDKLRDAGGSLSAGRLFHDCRYRIGDRRTFEQALEALQMQGRVARRDDGRTTLYSLKEH